MVAYFADEVVGRGLPFDRRYRIIRSDTGEERWVHGRGILERDAAGRPIRMLGTIADITEQREAQEALIRSERRHTAIFEGTAEAILVAEAATSRLRWVNLAACALFGYTRDELLELTVLDLDAAQHLPATVDRFRDVIDGRVSVARAVPCLRKDGTVLLADIGATAAAVDGTACIISSVTDVTERHRLEVHDRNLTQAIDQTSEAILITGVTAEIEYANPAFERLSGLRREQIVGGNASVFGSRSSPDAAGAMERAIADGAAWRGDLVVGRPDGTERDVATSVSPVRDAEGRLAGHVTVVRDVTDERALAAERRRLVTAVEQTTDSVIITDLKGTIEYVNPAFERASGYARDEVVGQNPRILRSGQQSAAFYRALWRRLRSGQTWTGTLVNRRKDGGLYQEEATISPIHGPDGGVTGYVGVQHDVTALRAAESGLAREFRERAEVAAALARLQPARSAEETAAIICDGLLGLAGIDLAAVVSFPDPQRAVPLAVLGPYGLPMAPGRPLPASRAAYLYARAAQGPWAEAWRPRPEDGSYGRAFADLGIRAMAYAPIRNGEGLLGLIGVGTDDEAYARHLIDHLPVVGEFAATASALLSGQLERGRRDETIRERVRGALARGGLRPVFQPIVALESGDVVGYEALSRFADGTLPEQLFAWAHSVSMGLELEVACLTGALKAADTLPRHAWLSLNASPDLILHPTALPRLLAGQSRSIVLEVTEHMGIDDYPAVRRAIEALGPRVRLAVDDAGAGFASLRHVVELQPKFLKLDIGLVRHVDRDVSRQAMIAGLWLFAARVGCDVIAEGIEEPAELAMLRELGIPLGQGHLLSRPAPARLRAGARASRTPAQTARLGFPPRIPAAQPSMNGGPSGLPGGWSRDLS